MVSLESFEAFTRRVLNAVRLGRLPEADTKKLERLLTRTKKKNLILARGILSALRVHGASEEDIKRFGLILEKASYRIEHNKEPFSKDEEKDLLEIFTKYQLSTGAAKKFSFQVDELLTQEIRNAMQKRKFAEDIVPSKKKVVMEKGEEESKEEKLLH